jgi:hypothetical protein
MADLTLPNVTSLASPKSKQLLGARFEVQRNRALRSIFEKYAGQSGEEASTNLARELLEPLTELQEGSVEDLQEVARYLADEYLQIGDKVLLIDRETGKAIATLTEEDIWQPPDVPRESGRMVKPLPRINPKVEALVISWKFEKKREEILLRDLSSRLAQTDEDKALGDRRLLATTRKGRSFIVDELRTALPSLIPTFVSGGLRRFIDLLSLEGDTTGMTSYLSFQSFARVKLGLQDAKARNLLFNIAGSHRSTIAAQWARDIALTVSSLMHDLKPAVAQSSRDKLPSGIWVASPEESMVLRRGMHTGITTIPIEGVPVTRFNGVVGRLDVRNTSLASREIHDRWEIVAQLDYDLHLRADLATPTILTDMPTPVFAAEVVR